MDDWYVTYVIDGKKKAIKTYFPEQLEKAFAAIGVRAYATPF